MQLSKKTVFWLHLLLFIKLPQNLLPNIGKGLALHFSAYLQGAVSLLLTAYQQWRDHVHIHLSLGEQDQVTPSFCSSWWHWYIFPWHFTIFSQILSHPPPKKKVLRTEKWLLKGKAVSKIVFVTYCPNSIIYHHEVGNFWFDAHFLFGFIYLYLCLSCIYWSIYC